MSPSVASPAEERWDRDQAHACMTKIQDAFPSWLKQCPGARESVARRIRLVVETLAGRFTSSRGTAETQQKVEKALQATQDLRALLDDLLSEDPILMTGGCSTTALADERQRTLGSIRREETRDAYGIGLQPRRAWVALAGLEQKLREVRSIAPKKRRARPKVHVSVGLTIDIVDELDRWRRRGLVEYSRPEQEALLDQVFGYLQTHFRKDLKRPDKNTVKSHRENHEAARAQLYAWAGKNWGI